MRILKQFFKSIALTTLLFAGFAAYGIAQDKTTIVDPEKKAPVITTTNPSGGEMNIDLGSVIKITFSTDMDEESINGTNLMLHATSKDSMHKDYSKDMMDDQIRDRSAINNSQNSNQYTPGVISGTISYSDKVAVFTPDEELKEGTLYTFTVTTGVESAENIPLESTQNWSFTTTGTTDSTYSDNQSDEQNGRSDMEESENRSMIIKSTNETKIIDLGKAGDFVILAKNDVNNESESEIMGNVGEGSDAKDSQKQNGISNSAQQSATGQNLESQSNKSDTASVDVNEGLKDMMSAFADASMHHGDDLTTHNTESFHHDPALAPGVHEWSDSLQVTSDVTLSGSADDVWLFRAGEDLTVQENTVFTLTNGARAENIFWYVEGDVTIGENAEFEGIILSMNKITLEKGAKLNGRIFSQTSITLDDNTITEPRSMTGQTTSKNE